MRVSKHIFKYMQKQNPKFGEVIKINGSKISCMDLEKIYNDEELNKIWLDTISNLEKIVDEVIPKRKTRQDIKEYRRNYYRNYYQTNEVYRSKKSYADKEKRTKIKILQEENEKLKNIINSIDENILSVKVNWLCFCNYIFFINIYKYIYII